MKKLIAQINNLRDSRVKLKVHNKLKTFASYKNKSNKAWFSELCFCLLTANSKARTAIEIQKELGHIGFCNSSAEDVCNCIKKHKHRFHNNKTNFIVLARKYANIKKIIQGIINTDQLETGAYVNQSETETYVNQSETETYVNQSEARLWLDKNIKGLGFKEASHFLRNVGYFNLAILDRHILNLMVEHKLINEKPKSLTKKLYVEIEQKFINLADNLNMKPAELDLYMWYMKTGDVLK